MHEFLWEVKIVLILLVDLGHVGMGIGKDVWSGGMEGWRETWEETTVICRCLGVDMETIAVENSWNPRW